MCRSESCQKSLGLEESTGICLVCVGGVSREERTVVRLVCEGVSLEECTGVHREECTGVRREETTGVPPSSAPPYLPTLVRI